MKAGTDRIFLYDLMKGLGMIAVVLAHIATNRNLEACICSFHMPLFFFVAGLLYKPKQNYISYLAERVLKPYFVFALVTYAYWFFGERFFRPTLYGAEPLSQFTNIFYPMNMTGPGPSYVFNSPLWFLPCFFVTCVTGYYLCTYLKKKLSVSLVLLVLVVFDNYYELWIPFYISEMLFALPFYLLAWLLKETDKKIMQIDLKNSYLIAFLSTIPFILAWFYSRPVGMKVNNYPFGYALCFFIAVVLIISLYIICKVIRHQKYLEWIGQNSLLIMVLHGPIERVLIYVTAMLISSDTNIIRESIPWSVTLMLLTLLFCVPCINFVKKYVRWLIA